jgi:hypothetical protein
MRKWMLMVAVLAMVAAMPLVAQADGEKKPEEKKDEQPAEPEKKEDGEAKDDKKEAEGDKDDLDKKLKRVLKGVEELVGKVEVTEDDVKLVLKHHKAAKAVTDKDEKFRKLKDENLKEAFDHLIKSEAYVAWCKKEGLEAEAYTRKALRVRTGYIKLYLPTMLDDAIKQQKDVLEEYKDEIPEADYKKAIAELTKAEEMFKRAKKQLEIIPAPTDAEKKAYEAHKEAIDEMMENDDAEEEDIEEGEDDGMGG